MAVAGSKGVNAWGVGSAVGSGVACGLGVAVGSSTGPTALVVAPTAAGRINRPTSGTATSTVSFTAGSIAA
jgi:hypothetical protein